MLRGLAVALAFILAIAAAPVVAADVYTAGASFSDSEATTSASRYEERGSAEPTGNGTKSEPSLPRLSQGENSLTPNHAQGDPSPKVANRRLSIFIPECWKGMVERNECKAAPEEGPSAAPTAPTASAAAPTRAEVETLVSSLVARLEVPVPTPSVGPDPSANEWNMAVVGYPLWLWTDTPASMDSSVSGYGITITMNARRVATTFDMGDGNRVTCARMTAYPASVKPGTPSPTCGYAYSWPSLPNGNYTVTATSRWEVDWSAVGFSGTLPLIASASRELPVGELHAVVVR